MKMLSVLCPVTNMVGNPLVADRNAIESLLTDLQDALELLSATKN